MTPVDIELGLQSVPSTPTTPEREDVVARSAPLADQAGDVAESDYTSQSPERQSSLPTTVDAETRPSPALVQGAWIDSNEVPKVNTDDAQTALTNMECQELRPTASDHL